MFCLTSDLDFPVLVKDAKKVTTLKRNLPIYETSAQSGQKKKRNSKSNLMFSIFPCTVFVFL